jgi:hypothetical protein
MYLLARYCGILFPPVSAYLEIPPQTLPSARPWNGFMNALITTRKTLNSHLQAIPFSSTPKVFRDVISFLHKLGLRYLWIDSLCIVQDDLEDWASQASLMASIYTGSYLTIAATRCANPSQNIYSRSVQIKTASRPLDPLQYKISFRRRLMHLTSPDHAAAKEIPLLRRGWIYQERLLSPRVFISVTVS